MAAIAISSLKSAGKPVPVSMVAFFIVFLASNAINILILLSPFTTVDAALKSQGELNAARESARRIEDDLARRIGEQPVVVGMQAVLEPGDSVITGYRDHGHMLVTGMDPKGVMAELTGRIGGYSKGKGGSMHMFSREKGFFGGHGIVGAQVPLGTGLAFANRYRGNDNVSLTYFGDGATNQGQVYEAFNMAALWKLPVIYVIENNRYAYSTPTSEQFVSPNLWERAKGYGMEGFAMDCSDPENVLKTLGAAIDRARNLLQRVRDALDI